MMLHAAYGSLDLARGRHQAALAAFRAAGSLAEQVGQHVRGARRYERSC